MKSILASARLFLAGAILLGFDAASGTPLSLNYSISPTGSGVNGYAFTLVLDNNDGSWVPGQNFNFLVFGDSAQSGEYVLGNFVIDPGTLPVGPFDSYFTVGGQHNGSGLINFDQDVNTGGWVPTSVGSSLSWAGSSPSYVGQGAMRFSTLYGNGTLANFEVATLQAVPEPSALALMLVGVGSVLVLSRRSNSPWCYA